MSCAFDSKMLALIHNSVDKLNNFVLFASLLIVMVQNCYELFAILTHKASLLH